ncbi:MAG: hypothetical protein ACJ761_05795 [Chloroflexota bacterium]
MIPVDRARRALLLVAILTLAAPESATAHGPDPTLSGGPFGKDQALQFRWRSGFVPPTAHRSAIVAAASAANSTQASRAATMAYSSTGPNTIGYGSGATCGPNGIACFTRTVPSSFTMWFREQGYRFDWGALRWCQSYSSPPDGCYDVENIALDEFGHVEGLNHHVNFADAHDYTDAVVQTVSRTKPSSGWNAHRFGRCDVARLQLMYDLQENADPYSTCLDLVTTLSLTAPSEAGPAGATARFAAILAVGIDPDYDQVSGDPLPGRKVSLQRRPPGGSTWTNVATMTATATSGTYVTNLPIYSTAEYRAVFAAPSSEGLRGRTSSTVTVTFVGCGKPCPQAAPAQATAAAQAR